MASTCKLKRCAFDSIPHVAFFTVATFFVGIPACMLPCSSPGLFLLCLFVLLLLTCARVEIRPRAPLHADVFYRWLGGGHALALTQVGQLRASRATQPSACCGANGGGGGSGHASRAPGGLQSTGALPNQTTCIRTVLCSAVETPVLFGLTSDNYYSWYSPCISMLFLMEEIMVTLHLP